MKLNLKRIVNVIVLFGVLIAPTRTFGLTLIDEQNYTNYLYYKGEEVVLNEEDRVEKYIDTDKVIDRDSWKGYKFREGRKYTVNKTMLHEFTADGEYIKTLKVPQNTEDIVEEMVFPGVRYIDDLNNEERRYIGSGFKGIPDLHLSVVDDKIRYFYQGENEIKPGISCVPTVAAMYLSSLGNDTIVPDDISKYITFSSKGTNIKKVASVLNTNYNIIINTESRYKNKENIISDLNEGIPVMSRINSGYLDYHNNTNENSDEFIPNRIYNTFETISKPLYHFVLITGYVQIGNELFLELYDPSSVEFIRPGGRYVYAGRGKYLEFSEYLRILG